MTRKRDIPRHVVTVRFEPSELAAIDEARGEITRQDWIATSVKLQLEEQRSCKSTT